MWGIVYSCITTIFACTYTSFHPDVPRGDYGFWDSIKLQICYIIIGFLVPELVVAKAASQFMEVMVGTDESPIFALSMPRIMPRAQTPHTRDAILFRGML